MAYTTINKSTDHFNTKLWTGNGGTQSITGVGFQPDFTWIRERSEARGHNLTDAVRGAPKYINTSSTGAEETSISTTLTSFDSDGFSLGSYDDVNKNSETYVGWSWKANGVGSANTDGTINTTATSVNTTAGFSIITYTGTGSAGTIGHGLGVVPDFWMVKARSETRAWYGWSKGMSYGDVVNFQSSGAKSTDTSLFTSNAPTNQVINLGSSVGVNNSGQTFVCYAFSSKTGYSKFGSYTGNGNADGTFVYTGFKPAFVIIKNSSNAHNWTMIDNKRLGYNDKNYILFPDLSNVEPTTSETDILSNGFKIRASANGVNQSGNTMIYMAFGQSLVGSNNVPCNAR